MPRVLFLIDDDSYFCWHRLDLARAVQQEGYEVLVATHVNEHGKQIEKEGFKLFSIRFRRGIKGPIHEFRTLWELIQLYRHERPDIVHHISLKHVLYGSIAARVTGVPVVVNAFTGLGSLFTTQTTKAKLLRAVIKKMLKWSLAHPSSLATFENDSDREDLVTAGVIRHGRTVVIRGVGINVSDFVPQVEPDGDSIVLLATRMLWDKGVGDFVQAAKLIKDRCAGIRCILVGALDPESPSAIDAMQLKSWEREGLVEWWGHRNDIKEVYRQAHVVVLPTYYGEGLPRVLLEAAASARPLVATRTRGCTDIVRDGENGLLVPIKDSTSLASAILRLIQDKPLRKAMGARGREIVVQQFSSEQIVKETLSVYHQLEEKSRKFHIS